MKADAGGLSDDERLAWLRLIRTPTIGPVTFRELVDHFGSASAALAAVPDLARRGGRPIRLVAAADAERELAGFDAIGARLVAISEPGYPPWLRTVDGAPLSSPSAVRQPVSAAPRSRSWARATLQWPAASSPCRSLVD